MHIKLGHKATKLCEYVSALISYSSFAHPIMRIETPRFIIIKNIKEA